MYHKIKPEWDLRFLRVALEVATWSKDPSTKVGAVIVRPDRRIVSTGYNGFPRGVLDDPAHLADRPTKYARTVHAELNAILQAREQLGGCEIFCTFPPCSGCTGAIIQSGITHVVCIAPEGDNTRWEETWAYAAAMRKEAKVSTWMYDFHEVVSAPSVS